MAVVRKISPKGIDIKIDKMQTILDSKLSSAGWTDYEVYPRAYKNYSKENLIPEISTSKGNYLEVLFDDTKNASSFFLVDDTTSVDDLKLTADVSIIFQANLKKLYPTITHRADEEMHVSIFEAVKINNIGFNLTGVVTGVKNVYQDLNLAGRLDELVRLDDMSYYHVVKLDFSLAYEIKCQKEAVIVSEKSTADSTMFFADSTLITADNFE